MNCNTKTKTSIANNLVADLNAAHSACCTAANDALIQAMRAGDLLAEAKNQCNHGEWQAWLIENFEGSKRTAQVYSRLAKHRDVIEAKAQDSALLSIGDAMKLLSPPEDDPRELPGIDGRIIYGPLFPAGATIQYAGFGETKLSVDDGESGALLSSTGMEFYGDLSFEGWERLGAALLFFARNDPANSQAESTGVAG